MKKKILLIVLFAFLLIGSTKMNIKFHKVAIKSVSACDEFVENNHKQFSKLNLIGLFIENNDIDIEEEFSSNNDTKSNKPTQVKQSFFYKWYCCYENPKLEFYYKRFFNCEPNVIARSTPIYISQGVLRI